MSFADTLDNLTGKQLERVEALTGVTLEQSRGQSLSFAIGYVRTLSHETLRSKTWRDGWDDYLSNTSFIEARRATGQEDEDTDPKDAPAS